MDGTWRAESIQSIISYSKHIHTHKLVSAAAVAVAVAETSSLCCWCMRTTIAFLKLLIGFLGFCIRLFTARFVHVTHMHTSEKVVSKTCQLQLAPHYIHNSQSRSILIAQARTKTEPWLCCIHQVCRFLYRHSFIINQFNPRLDTNGLHLIFIILASQTSTRLGHSRSLELALAQ